MLLLGGCAASPSAPLADIARPTIVSLNPCADAVLAEVAAPGQLLAISHWSKDPETSSMEPAAAARFDATGGTAEEVIALGPDVVVGDTFMAPTLRDALERAGIRVETVGIVADLPAAEAQVRQLAGVAGDEARGEAMVRRMDRAWNAPPPADAPLDVLVWQDGGIVPGEETLIAAMLTRTGFRLHSAARGLGQGAYLPLEEVLADPPALVLTTGDERMLTHPVLGQVPGLAYAQLDGNLLYCGGPTIPRALARLREIRREAA
ncbi:hypothetical protein AAW00_05640 [Aurantiacibacter luteus]|uniref:Fe/B12 periplasmic-binding domain-containing protein n=1 Tax=Aurantiacibacter luteus TaxID=1581420 RepID=A0A0G9MZI2_9SPHN|nr:hypothetical protein AAW00_05640 [Aurantiacibacter luteus]